MTSLLSSLLPQLLAEPSPRPSTPRGEAARAAARLRNKARSAATLETVRLGFSRFPGPVTVRELAAVTPYTVKGLRATLQTMAARGQVHIAGTKPGARSHSVTLWAFGPPPSPPSPPTRQNMEFLK